MYLSVPGHRKLLPRPCPQCGQENGGCQWVLFNPKFYLKRTGYARDLAYIILRISHYSNELYKQSSKRKRWKIYHNFRIERHQLNIRRGEEIVPLDEIFNDRIYQRKHSITMPFTVQDYEYYKFNGWPKIETKRAHWLNKAGLKKCNECHILFKNLTKSGHGRYAPWLCATCYPKYWETKKTVT